MDLELFTSHNFIGLFVKENQSQILRKLTNEFAEIAEKLASRFQWLFYYLKKSSKLWHIWINQFDILVLVNFHLLD